MTGNRCPLCDAPAEIGWDGQRDGLVVHCDVCLTFWIDGRLFDHFREMRSRGEAPTAWKALSIGAAATWRDGGRLNLTAENWLPLATEQQMTGSIERGDDDTARGI
jgi:hypothetical protein